MQNTDSLCDKKSTMLTVAFCVLCFKANSHSYVIAKVKMGAVSTGLVARSDWQEAIGEQVDYQNSPMSVIH